MAVGFPVKDDYVTGDVLTAANMNDFAGTLNTVEAPLGNAAGKNKIINGDFGIWQRGTTFSTSAAYTSDRWELLFDGSAATRAITRQSFTAGTAPVAGYEGKFFFRYDQSVAGSGATFNIVRNKMEDVQTYAGQTVTLSFWAKASATTTMDGIRFTQNFGSGGSGGVSTTAVEDPIFTISWTRYSYTVAIPSISGKTIGANNCLELRFLFPINSTFTVDIWGVQVEAGSAATPFQTATGTLQGELAACQRYYFRNTAGAAGQHFGNGNNQSTTVGVFIMEYPTQMRIAPTALEQSGTAGDYSIRHQATSTTASAVPAFESASLTKGIFTITVASGLTAGNGSFARPVNSTAYLGWSAEL